MPHLNAFPLAELLRELDLQELSGAVRLERESARAVVYLEAGKPVFAASNIKELRFGEYLVRRELVSREQLARFSKIADGALGKELLGQQILDSDTLEQASISLANEIVRVLLLWTAGSWEYDERARLADSYRASIDVPSLLLAGARKMDSHFIATRFQDQAEIISPAGDARNAIDLLPYEGFLLSRLDQAMPLNELLSLSGQAEELALQVVYGLALGGFMQRSSWPATLQLVSTDQPQIQPQPEPTKEKEIQVKPPTETDEQQLERFFGQVESAQTHYHVLDLGQGASADEIKRSYYSLARRYHPDRFHANPQIHRRVESAFARITQAYEALNDPRLRAKYDNRLAAEQKLKNISDTAPTGQQPSQFRSPAAEKAQESAEMSFREGYAALQSGQVNRALPHLSAAASSAPNEPRYRAYYGRALASSGKGQRLAETEFQAALKLDPNNASYHLMLAQLYYDLTFFKRARAEAARALELDPSQTEAQTLLNKMENK